MLAGHLDAAAPDRPGDRPNPSRMVFLDPRTRDLYADWERKAQAVVGSLRQIAGHHPEDALLASLVGELSTACPEFAALWSDHRVRPCEADSYRLRHPPVGELTVTQQIVVPAPPRSSSSSSSPRRRTPAPRTRSRVWAHTQPEPPRRVDTQTSHKSGMRDRRALVSPA
ncbi:MmyB family transcriptional regulator [Streptomyces niveus]